MHLMQEKFKLEVGPGNHTSDPLTLGFNEGWTGGRGTLALPPVGDLPTLSNPGEGAVDRQSHFHGEPVLCSESRAGERKGSG